MGLSAPPRAGRRPARRRPDEAESVYWLDLRKHKNNGWALSRQLQALRAQKKDAIDLSTDFVASQAVVGVSRSRHGRVGRCRLSTTAEFPRVDQLDAAALVVARVTRCHGSFVREGN